MLRRGLDESATNHTSHISLSFAKIDILQDLRQESREHRHSEKSGKTFASFLNDEARLKRGIL